MLSNIYGGFENVLCDYESIENTDDIVLKYLMIKNVAHKNAPFGLMSTLKTMLYLKEKERIS